MHFLGKSAQKTEGTFALFRKKCAKNWALLHFLEKSAQKTGGRAQKTGGRAQKLEGVRKNWGGT